MANPARDFQESQIFPGSVIRGLNRPAFSILIVLLLESLTGHIRGSQAGYYNRDKFGSRETRLSESDFPTFLKISSRICHFRIDQKVMNSERIVRCTGNLSL